MENLNLTNAKEKPIALEVFQRLSEELLNQFEADSNHINSVNFWREAYGSFKWLIDMFIKESIDKKFPIFPKFWSFYSISNLNIYGNNMLIPLHLSFRRDDKNNEVFCLKSKLSINDRWYCSIYRIQWFTMHLVYEAMKARYGMSNEYIIKSKHRLEDDIIIQKYSV